MVRGFGSEKSWDPIADIFGIVQTAFYIDFAWVYYSRQRVKLRHGGIVGSEDFQRGWLVNKVFSFKSRGASREEDQPLQEDEESRQGTGDAQPTANRWGPRGISVSADDTLEHQSHGITLNDEDEGLGEGFDERDRWDENNRPS